MPPFVFAAVRSSTQVVMRAYGIGSRSKEEAGGRDNGREVLGGEGYR